MGLDYKKTFYIGLGFFTTGITWSLFNAYVPIFLSYFGIPFILIGFIMTLDNISAITLQPFIGARSDKTWSDRFGRRIPYLLIGIPLAAFFFTLIPIFTHSDIINFENLRRIFGFGPEDIVLDRTFIGFVFFSIWIICFNIAMALYRAPTVALMPDIIENEYRGRANGIINLMGGIGTVFAFAVGSILYDMNWVLPFLATSGLMIAALIILVIKIKEPKVPMGTVNEEEKVNIIEGFKEVFRSRDDKSILFILLAIFFWFFGYNVVETWFTIYGKQILNISESAAAFSLNLVAIPFILMAIPAGIIAERISRKKTIMIGLLMIIICISLVSLLSLIVNPQNTLSVILICFPIVGIGWSLVNINSITMVWEIGKGEKQGAYTGIYYFFSQAAAIIGPPIIGLFFDIFGTPLPLFPLSTIFFVLAFMAMFFVKSGEYQKE
ncbi:MAG: MFS transporter [Promethearchaeota archaeon]